jgi:hypothetical protein
VKILSISAIRVALAAGSFTGMALLAVIDQAKAGKGITPTGTGTYKASPVVRDHRGEPPVGKPGPHPGKHTCSYRPETPGCRPIVRDHRSGGPRVVPKEDSPQRW